MGCVAVAACWPPDAGLGLVAIYKQKTTRAKARALGCGCGGWRVAGRGTWRAALGARRPPASSVLGRRPAVAVAAGGLLARARAAGNWQWHMALAIDNAGAAAGAWGAWAWAWAHEGRATRA
jgi:hypothetical protein